MAAISFRSSIVTLLTGLLAGTRTAPHPKHPNAEPWLVIDKDYKPRALKKNLSHRAPATDEREGF